MPEFKPIRQPFDLIGIDLVHPPERMAPGKYPYLLNARSVVEGTITARPGYSAPVNAAPFDQLNVHSVRRMNNSLPTANPTSRRFLGAGTKLYSADQGLIDSGYSGNPLSLVVWRPDQSVEPWMYVGDSLRMQKCRMDGATQTHYNVGIAPPRQAPSILLDQPQAEAVDDFSDVSGYSHAGTAGAASSVARPLYSTRIGVLIFDGPEPGWCNIVPFNTQGNYGWIGEGMLMTLSGTEELVVQEVHLQVTSSTIAGVQFDMSGTVNTAGTAVTWVSGSQFNLLWTGAITINGSSYTISTVNSPTSITLTGSAGTQTGVAYGGTGLCTIQAAQPLAGLDRNSIMELYVGGFVTTVGTAVTWSSGTKFNLGWTGPISINGVIYTIATVNSATSITLTTSAGTQASPVAYNGPTNEFVAVQSYVVGPDGLYNFRCYTEFNHVAGEPIMGAPAFRVFTTLSHAASDAITATAIKSTVTVGTGTLTRTIALDLSQVGAVAGGATPILRPLTPDDFFHISLMVDSPGYIIQILIQLDVDASVNDFTRNYYQINVQQNLAQALLTGGDSALSTLSAAAQATLINDVSAPAGSPGFAGAAASNNDVPNFLQLYGGNLAWTEILVPLAQLQRVGDDTTRSLANVQAVQLLIQCTNTVNFEASGWWVGGGFGPNTGLPESAYLIHRYRYRSSLTGAKSQQSPGVRTGVQAFRQQIMVTPQVSLDPQVDLIDIERFGGVLNEWHYVGTTPNNAGSFPFMDTYADDEIKTAPPLETDAVMPFVSFDVPMTGTVNVVGTQVSWASGALFNINWAPGQEILIAGIAYTVYGQPGSATSLQTVENVGVLTGVPFLVAEPTLIGQPLPYIIGPFDQGNFLLAWGDPRNPGVIYATKGNDPDSSPIPYYLELSDPSEPIIGGVIWDNNAIVASNKRFWRISIDANAVETGQGNVLVKQELQVGRGLFAPWAICAGPLIWFLDEAGVPCETNGGPAVSIVENDLRPLFPHDGGPGVVVSV